MNGIGILKHVFHFMCKYSSIGDFGDHLIFFLIIRYFEQDILKFNPNVRLEEVWNKFEHQFSDWLKQYVSDMQLPY